MKSKLSPLSPSRTRFSYLLPVLMIVLSLVAIFSTTISQTVQEQLLLGLPFILWFWLAITIFLVVVMVVTAWILIRDANYHKDSE